MGTESTVKFLLDLDTKQFEKGASNALKEISHFAGGFASLTFGTSVLSNLGSQSLSMASDFDYSFAKVSTLFGDVEVDTASLENQIDDLSVTSGFAATELADGLYGALSAGVPVTEDMTDAMSFMVDMTKLSTAGFTDLEKATDLTTTVLNAYGMEIDNTSHVTDVLIATQNAGKTTIDELASSMGKAIPSASSLGVSFEELSAGMAIMTKNGFATAESSTALNALFKEGLTDTSKLNEAYREMSGKSMKELIAEGASLSDVLSEMNDYLIENEKSWYDVTGSSEAAAAAQTLMKDDGEELNSLVQDMTENTGLLNESYSDMETTQLKVDKAQSAWNNSLKRLGEKILPIVNEALDIFINNAEWLTPLILGITIAVGIMAIAMGIGFLATSGLAGALWGLVIAGLAALWPILLIVAAIGLFVYALFWAYDNLDWFREMTDTILELMKKAWDIWQKYVKKVLEFFIKSIKNTYQEHKELFDLMGKILIAFLVVAVITLAVGFVAVLGTAGLAVALFAGGFAGAFELIAGILEEFFIAFAVIWDNVVLILGGIINFIKGVFTGDWEKAWQGINDIFEGIIYGIANTFIFGLNVIIGALNAFSQTVGNLLIKSINLIPGVNISLIPTFDKIDYFAEGGIVDGAGIGVIGEAGPEMILPLNSQGASFIQGVLGGMMQPSSGGGDIVFNIDSINGVENADMLGEIMVDLIDERLGDRL